MKISSASLSALLVGTSFQAASAVCDFAPGYNVTDHSKSAVDAANIGVAAKSGDAETALAIYTTPSARESKSHQDLATKDWAAAGAPDDIYQAYVAVLGEDFLDSYNLDSINCNGRFEGLSASMCAISATKNAICTSLSYALYEYAKAGGDAGSEFNWEEGFAFWHGLYEQEVDGVGLGDISAYGVQTSRDADFGTSFKDQACTHNNNGQGKDRETMRKELDGIAATLTATFAQATLKYASQMLAETDQDKIDAKWGEGYTYFRCGAGLMDAEVASYIEENFSPLTNDYPTDDTVLCGMVTKMAETEDLGYGVSIGDLNLLEFSLLADVESRCGIVLPTAEAEETASVCEYTPSNDVTDHSYSAIDTARITGAVKSGDIEEAMTLYTTPTARAGNSHQDMATKDWAAAGAPDDIYQAYVAVLGEDFLDSYNLDSINCNGRFEGLSSSMCSISATKNAICTSLNYALYEYAKAGGGAGSEKNWDEGFAFWHGLYENDIGGVSVGDFSAFGVQKSRDADFGTSFKDQACTHNNNGQGADEETKNKELEGILAAITATFAQATLKYAAQMLDERDQDKIDAKWGEGYTYFRCGAGLMDPELASYIEQNFSPLRVDEPTDDTVLCGIVRKMAATEDLGYGVTIGDLNVAKFPSLKNVESRCNIILPSSSDNSSSPMRTTIAGLATVMLASIALW